ncbi:UNVERIFIED_CONTAM: Retrovirus-related Pol polyprotein from transposon gypsy [Sesamum angustifolium]|uniref:Retrovirus-related Pol polyprotein from transposon gypsy n=1 Tax=Sesamum angustifolium TaxID=2727405 RepID=A0AAW2LDS4_9LAMI
MLSTSPSIIAVDSLDAATHLPVDLFVVLHSFVAVFSPVPSLPPYRPHDHHIHLPHSPSINIKPYRYPHCHKEPMNRLISKILCEGLFGLTLVPSPCRFFWLRTMMVSWRFCTDYRALNVVTIKDKFSILQLMNSLMNCGVLHSFPNSISGPVDYLGHIISAIGISPDPSMLKVIEDSPIQHCLMVFRAFLDLTVFYRRFVKNYAFIASPLTDLLRSTSFAWPPTAQAAFVSLKAAMPQLPVPSYLTSIYILTSTLMPRRLLLVLFFFNWVTLSLSLVKSLACICRHPPHMFLNFMLSLRLSRNGVSTS